MDNGEHPGHMKQDHESLPSLIELVSSHQEAGFDTFEENSSSSNQLQPIDYQVFNKDTEMRAGHSWNDASHRKGSHSRVHSVSISMPTSPMGHHMTSNKAVIFSAHSQRLCMKDNLNASPPSEPWGARHARFYSQQIPKGITCAEATHSLQFPNYHAPPRFKDRRFDSFKTLSAKVERQLLCSRGKPVEPEIEQTEIEAMPVDRYFDALEGPELDTLRPTEEPVLPEDRLWPFLLRYPISTFTICLGTSSQAVLWKTLATSLSTKFLHVSLTVNFVLWCIAIALVALVAFTYCMKVVIYFEAVRREYYHPLRVNFFFAPWIALLFLALGVPPSVAKNLPHALWYVLMTPIFCLELKIYGQWMSGGQRRLSKVANPSNHLSIVGNFVGALLGASMGLKEGPLFFFAVGLAHYAVLFVTLYQRLPTNETLPKELHPVFFLFVAAPSAASMAWTKIKGSFDYGSRIVYFIALFLYFSLAVQVNFFIGFRFSIAWWAYTFPMTEAAIATIKYANEQCATSAAKKWFNLRNDSSDAKWIENYLKFMTLDGKEKESSVKSDGKDLEASVGVPSIHGSMNGSMNDCSWNQGSFLKINEMDLLRAVISGYLDPSSYHHLNDAFVTSAIGPFMPRWVVSSSCSTNETIVADSDAEIELATSDQPAELDRKGEGSGDDVALSSRRNDQKTNFVEHNDRTMIRIKNDDDPKSGNSDILYSQNLIVRDVSLPVSTASTTNNQVINFKRFRKVNDLELNFTPCFKLKHHSSSHSLWLPFIFYHLVDMRMAIQSGNSFNNLVPFAKHPYTDSDYENKEVIEYVREEKKRKHMEAIAEDLFNNEKVSEASLVVIKDNIAFH
ncbi:hypothetical protein Ancab_009844 [Ancistrocladus abbreviatus]